MLTLRQPPLITGQVIAKTKWEPQFRAQLAAGWKLHKIDIDPSTKIAATVFGVCEHLARKAVTDMQQTQTLEEPENMTNAELAQLARTVRLDRWLIAADQAGL